MASLADLTELVGFFSYSREDDIDSQGALSALRTRIQGELRSQLGRTAKTFRLWQDKEAISAGTLWKAEIETAVAQSAFFIPIITPTVLNSEFCQFELQQFLAREAALGRDDLVFPILYIRVPALEDSTRRDKDPVISIIAKRQYMDWRRFRHRPINSPEVLEELESFCAQICDALSKRWIAPEERKAQDEALALQRAEAERKRQEAEVRRREEEARQKAQARQRSAQGRRLREAEAEAVRRAEEERLQGFADVPLSPDHERALKPKDTFKEGPNCPQMVVVPAGTFIMGSPASEPGRRADEGPQHKVTIAQSFAVAMFALTFDEWDACVADGGCSDHRPDDRAWGRGRQPVIYVSWDHAKAYVAWLSKRTGKRYRLLSEAEWEYAARGATQTVYPWGDAFGNDKANCNGCDSRWGGKQTAPVGQFAPNGFGLYDMVGNVWQWVEDCYHTTYQGAPRDGSAWVGPADCSRRVVRGGSWYVDPQFLRSAVRGGFAAVDHGRDLGFRVGRTLITP